MGWEEMGKGEAVVQPEDTTGQGRAGQSGRAEQNWGPKAGLEEQNRVLDGLTKERRDGGGDTA